MLSGFWLEAVQNSVLVLILIGGREYSYGGDVRSHSASAVASYFGLLLPEGGYLVEKARAVAFMHKSREMEADSRKKRGLRSRESLQLIMASKAVEEDDRD